MIKKSHPKLQPETGPRSQGLISSRGEGQMTSNLPGTLKLTACSHLKMGEPWKRRFLLETTIFRAYVSFRECN